MIHHVRSRVYKLIVKDRGYRVNTRVESARQGRVHQSRMRSSRPSLVARESYRCHGGEEWKDREYRLQVLERFREVTQVGHI